MKVKLSEILMGLKFSNSENQAYLNFTNGRVITLSQSDISAAEDGDNFENSSGDAEYWKKPVI